jgi:hypothetical protein
MLKILRCQTEEGNVQFTLIGRLETEHVNEVRGLIRQERDGIVLELREVKLVDRSAIEFLAECEEDGVVLNNCSPYIRDWVTREAARKRTSSNKEEGSGTPERLGGSNGRKCDKVA